jgi:4-hydroxythreonine-4-phosphate dehydrogenase/1,2-dihydroxy-3,5-cyclohexadiene-1,4-dicarboxylate dehydrogenase
MQSRVALTMGDPNGIGPEIALKALAALTPEERNRVVVYGPLQVLQFTAHSLGLEYLLTGLAHTPAGELPISSFQPGKVNAHAGFSAVHSASAAIQDCRDGLVIAVVAGPHHETAIAQAGITFSGYPSLVASVCELAANEVFLMLVGGGLRIVHVTLHESVEQALSRLSSPLVISATLAGVRACDRLGVINPRIGLFGINPHASEGTLFGPHDKACTVPAAQTLRDKGLNVSDPQGADVLLADHQIRPHDFYVAMFHDQGHIPIKLLAPQGATALSIGADVLLATTGHGSAMDIAGQGIARPDALLRSLRLVMGTHAA